MQGFGSSQLGKDNELLQKLKLGQVDFALPSSVMSSVADEFGVFEMPYIITSRDHMRRVRDELGESVLDAAARERGYRILGFFENGFRHITNNTRPIECRPISKGVKLRTPNGEWRVKMFQQYGANPTPMAFSDVFTALQDRRHRRPGEPLRPDRVGEVPGGAGVPVDHRSRLHARPTCWSPRTPSRSCPRTCRPT